MVRKPCKLGQMTAKKLSDAIASHEKNQGQIAQDLGITSTTLGRWRKGERSFGESDAKLLRLYFFGKMPFDLLRDRESLKNTLRFTMDEWAVILILAKREGFKTAADWVAGKIRGYLENSPAAIDVRRGETTGFQEALENVLDKDDDAKQAGLGHH